jgi:hypothetical protein
MKCTSRLRRSSLATTTFRGELATVCAPAISEQGKWLGRPRLLKLPRRAERLRECCGGKKILLRLNSAPVDASAEPHRELGLSAKCVEFNRNL